MRTFDGIAGTVISIGAIAFITNVFVGREGFDFGYLGDRATFFRIATQVTLYATTISFLIGMGIGFLVGWARTAKSVPLKKILRDRRNVGAEDKTSPFSVFGAIPIMMSSGTKYLLRRIADGYVEVVRGTPLFVQIVFAWSVLLVNYPRLDQLALIAGIIALTVNTGGYQGEIFRAGLQTIHAGQVEAARGIGLSRLGAMRHVILPQALRLIIPPLTNEYIGLLKASSLLLVIGVQELTTVGRSLAFREFKVFEVFALVTGLYLLLTVPVSKLIQYIETRYQIPGLGIREARARF